MNGLEIGQIISVVGQAAKTATTKASYGGNSDVLVTDRSQVNTMAIVAGALGLAAVIGLVIYSKKSNG